MELDIDPDEEEKDDINIDNERERHWRNVFEDNERGVDEKALLHAKRWDLYLNQKEKIVKGKYSVEVVGEFCVCKTHKNEIRQSDAQGAPTDETPQSP